MLAVIPAVRLPITHTQFFFFQFLLAFFCFYNVLRSSCNSKSIFNLYFYMSSSWLPWQQAGLFHRAPGTTAGPYKINVHTDAQKMLILPGPECLMSLYSDLPRNILLMLWNDSLDVRAAVWAPVSPVDWQSGPMIAHCPWKKIKIYTARSLFHQLNFCCIRFAIDEQQTQMYWNTHSDKCYPLLPSIHSSSTKISPFFTRLGISFMGDNQI